MQLKPQSRPKRAVILAAGLGTRLRPFTDDRPKSLVPVHGQPILHSALFALARFGVTDVTIVVGYRKEVIQLSCGNSFAGLTITYVESAVFESTGSAYSLWLARETLLQGDALLLEGDVLFESNLLEKLLASQTGDVAAIAPFDETMTGSAIHLDSTGHIAGFRMNQTAADLEGSEPLYKTINVFRFAGSTLRNVFVPALENFIKKIDERGYVEQLMARIIDDLDWKLAGAHCGDMKWFEIDSESDLRTAEQIFAPSDARRVSRDVIQAVPSDQ